MLQVVFMFTQKKMFYSAANYDSALHREDNIQIQYIINYTWTGVSSLSAFLFLISRQSRHLSKILTCSDLWHNNNFDIPRAIKCQDWQFILFCVKGTSMWC